MYRGDLLWTSRFDSSQVQVPASSGSILIVCLIITQLHPILNKPFRKMNFYVEWSWCSLTWDDYCELYGLTSMTKHPGLLPGFYYPIPHWYLSRKCLGYCKLFRFIPEYTYVVYIIYLFTLKSLWENCVNWNRQ